MNHSATQPRPNLAWIGLCGPMNRTYCYLNFVVCIVKSPALDDCAHNNVVNDASLTDDNNDEDVFCATASASAAAGNDTVHTIIKTSNVADNDRVFISTEASHHTADSSSYANYSPPQR